MRRLKRGGYKTALAEEASAAFRFWYSDFALELRISNWNFTAVSVEQEDATWQNGKTQMLKLEGMTTEPASNLP